MAMGGKGSRIEAGMQLHSAARDRVHKVASQTGSTKPVVEEVCAHIAVDNRDSVLVEYLQA